MRKPRKAKSTQPITYLDPDRPGHSYEFVERIIGGKKVKVKVYRYLAPQEDEDKRTTGDAVQTQSLRKKLFYPE